LAEVEGLFSEAAANEVLPNVAAEEEPSTKE
jgi:hypothetical protein